VRAGSVGQVNRIVPGGRYCLTGVLGGGGPYNQPTELMVWETGTGRRVFTRKGVDVSQAVVSPAARLLAASTADRDTPRAVRVWDLGRQDPAVFWGHPGRVVKGLCLSSDGRHLTAGVVAPRFFGLKEVRTPGEVRVWDLDTGELAGRADGPWGRFVALAWHDRPPRLATAAEDGRVRLWDL